MAIHLFIAPAGAGKTQACVDWARAVRDERPLAPVWVCLPNRAQVSAFRARLAAAGGALGVEVGTFYALYQETLRASGQPLAELSEPLQHRLLRAIVDEAATAGRLGHYLALRDKPGFVRALHRLIEELKQARIEPQRLLAATRGQGPRLEELADLYAAYQLWLQDEEWMDAEGLGWLAAAALERHPALFAHWHLVLVDGFDQLNQTQVAYLAQLARQVRDLWVTLTYGPQPGRLAHRRFEQALTRLEIHLAVQAEPLPGACVRLAPPLAHLEARLFEAHGPAADPGEALACLEAPNPPAEVRAALRWLKQRLVTDGMACGEVAILARDLEPYAPFLAETAQEFGIPLYLMRGMPLAGNPAVASLLTLLSLARRDRASASVQDGRFPVRQVLEVLRSPYYNWRDCRCGDEPLGLTPGDVDRLEEAAQAGQVLAGIAQWHEALALRRAQAEEAGTPEEDDGPAAGALPAQAWADLSARLERFMARVTPPAEDTVAGYTVWVEDLIGDAPDERPDSEEQGATGLQLLACLQAGPVALCERDTSALRALKDALRGLVWADAALHQGQPVPYERYLDDLAGVVAASSYTATESPPAGAVLAAAVHDARGLSYRAVALLGLSEGLFPQPAASDPLLRDSDREWLVSLGLPLAAPEPGAEFTLFYEASTRARERLLLTRPYLTEAGQPWEPSPFWDEVLAIYAGRDRGGVERQPMPWLVRVRSTDPLPPAQAASWPELATALCHQVRAGATSRAQVAAALADEPEARTLWQSIEVGAAVLTARGQGVAAGPFEGDCSALGPALARFSARRVWSASRLESYLSCPLAFYLGHALALEPPMAPVAGFDAAQLGQIYHEVLERVFRQAPAGVLEETLTVLPAVADEVLAQAPQRLGFRPSRLWEQEQACIRQDLENTLRALAACSEGWQPCGLEVAFGRPGDPAPAQRIEADGHAFLLSGVIDRIDRNGEGQVRLIDYKSGGESIGYRDLLEGRRIQLALYAWAVEGVLAQGTVVAGFYWHVRAAKRSTLTLEGFAGGASMAMQQAAARAWQAVEGASAGQFSPQPPESGCPSYCPGSAFCWRYATR